MPKYFRDGFESKTIAENLEQVSLNFPDITAEGDFEVFTATMAGELNAGFRLAQRLDPGDFVGQRQSFRFIKKCRKKR